MITLLYDFSNQCSKAGIVPSERHIDAFLMKVYRTDLREEFIKFCFYSWDNRMEVLDKLTQLDLKY